MHTSLYVLGLASDWPCVTDNSGIITTYGLIALERQMSTPPIPSRSVAHFTFTMYVHSNLRLADKLHDGAYCGEYTLRNIPRSTVTSS